MANSANPREGFPDFLKNGELSGKMIGRDKGQTMAVKLGIEQHAHSWDLIAYNPDGSIQGVAAHGPIQSLPIILTLMEKLGVRPMQKLPDAMPPFLKG